MKFRENQLTELTQAFYFISTATSTTDSKEAYSKHNGWLCAFSRIKKKPSQLLNYINMFWKLRYPKEIVASTIKDLTTAIKNEKQPHMIQLYALNYLLNINFPPIESGYKKIFDAIQHRRQHTTCFYKQETRTSSNYTLSTACSTESFAQRGSLFKSSKGTKWIKLYNPLRPSS